MTKKHARLSPSSADRWTSCTASPLAQDDIPNENSDASRMGTVCHRILEECLLDVFIDAFEFVGREAVFWHHPESEAHGNDWGDEYARLVETPDGGLLVEEARVVVDEEMAYAVDTAVRYVQERHALRGGKLLVEQRVPIGQFTDEDDAEGSADVILLGDTWIEVMDAKFGFKQVTASKIVKPSGIDCITGEFVPETRLPNLQMSCYALGSIHRHDLFGEITDVTMTIVQPFINNIDEFSCDVSLLREVEAFLATKADETRFNPQFNPSLDACFFCRVRGRCKAQTWKALSTALDRIGEDSVLDIAPIDSATLGSAYALSAFVRRWADDVDAAMQKALASGEVVRRDDGLAYKLIDGRRGRRKWSDALQAEGLMKSAPLAFNDMYDVSLISPAVAESLTKKKRDPQARPPPLGRAQWAALQALITQPAGSPQIALETDPRPAISRADGFEEVGD